MPTGAYRAIALASTLLLAACAAPTSVTSTYTDDAYAKSSFRNFLVIGVAGNYNSRAQFERQVASGLREEGATASTYYSIVEGNEPISREAVLTTVKSGGFDAVLVTRVVAQQTNIDVEGGSTDTKASTRGGGPINFFRYDYEEISEPESINLTTTVVLASELFSAADEKMIWSIEVENSDASNAGILIDNVAATIVGRLAKDRLIGR